MSACSKPAPRQANAPANEPVRITHFYSSPAHPPPGTKTLLCYGVENATVVRLDPPVDTVWPAVARCLEIVPKTPATFTLTAERGVERVQQSITIGGGVPKAEILEVRVDSLEVAPGEKTHVCYKARNAASVTVTPGAWLLEHTPERGCVAFVQDRTTTYTVQANDMDGNVVDTEKVTVRMKR